MHAGAPNVCSTQTPDGAPNLLVVKLYKQLWAAPDRCWEQNSGPLPEQHVILNAKPSLQPLGVVFLRDPVYR